MCKGHGCLDRTEIITLTAILSSAAVPKTQQLTSGENARGDSEDEDFIQRLYVSFSEGDGEEPPVTGESKGRYAVSLGGAGVEQDSTDSNLYTVKF